jgi:hypothetical protein
MVFDLWWVARPLEFEFSNVRLLFLSRRIRSARAAQRALCGMNQAHARLDLPIARRKLIRNVLRKEHEIRSRSKALDDPKGTDGMFSATSSRIIFKLQTRDHSTFASFYSLPTIHYSLADGAP